MSAFDYDLFVIGGGSGGVRAARVAAGEAGAKVALAEEDRYGGTCVIRGCVPKKLMVFASGYGGMVEEATHYGWDMRAAGFDWQTFSGRLNTELDRLEGVYRKLLAGSGVTTFDARARMKDPHTVELSTGETVTAKHILIATGGRPVRPDMKNAHLGIVSDDIFHLTELPKSILIVGGGYIACEFACILNGLGVEVTQYYRGAQILRGFDEEARGLIADEMSEKGIKIHTGTNIVEMYCAPNGEDDGLTAPMEARQFGGDEPEDEKVDGPIRVKATNGHTEDFDVVLFATGRRPNTDDMGLEDLGLTLGRNGQIEVDAYSQTKVPSIYAIGDVTDRVNLTPVAIREGMAFVETVFNRRSRPDPVCGFHPAGIRHRRSERGRGARPGADRGILHVVPSDADRLCRKTGPRADEAGGERRNPKGSGLSHRRAGGGRNDPDGGHCDQDGRDKRGFRPDRGGASDHVGRNRHHAQTDAHGLNFQAMCTGIITR